MEETYINMLSPPEMHRKKPRERRVLALCGDSQVGLWMVRNLAQNGLNVLSVCRSPQGLAAHSRYSTGACVLPLGARHPRFLGEIENLARQHDIASIMPIDEGHHAALIDNRDRFEPDIHIFSPSANGFRMATDKNYLHHLCRQLGIPVARGTTLDKLMAQPDNLSLNYPLVLRTSNQNLTGPGQRTPFKAAWINGTWSGVYIATPPARANG